MIASAYAPGRVELLGNHTDYNQGLVLGAAIDRGLTVEGSAREDGVIELNSAALQRSVRLPLDRVARLDDEVWANYPLGVVAEFLEAGFRIGGFTATISGNLPPGSGLSSSAALEVATARFLMKLHGWEMPPLDLAKLCQRAENRFVGVQSGLLDQITSIFGRKNHIVSIDCRTEQISVLPCPDDIALVIADSGKKHSLVQGEYNLRREQCTAAAHALGVTSLRDVSVSALETFSRSLDPLLRRRAAHVIGENERVRRALECIGERDMAGFGALMNASHESSRTNFENSSPELDLLVSIARSLPGVFGARLTGGGFGGAIVALTATHITEAVSAALGEAYMAKSGSRPAITVCRPAAGAE